MLSVRTVDISTNQSLRISVLLSTWIVILQESMVPSEELRDKVEIRIQT